MNPLNRLGRWVERHIVADDPHPELSRLDRMDREIDARPTPEHQAARRQFAEHMAAVSDVATPVCGEQHVSLAGGTFTCSLPRGHADWNRMVTLDGHFVGGWQPKTTERTPVYDQIVAERIAAAKHEMPALLPMKDVDALITAGKASADIREDYLDAVTATADQLWEMFDVETETDR